MKNKGSVTKSILRGRAALKEAEARIKLFEDYMRQSTRDEANEHTHEDTAPFDDTSVDCFSQYNNDQRNDGDPKQYFDQAQFDTEKNDVNLDLTLIHEMMDENKAIRRRDEYIEQMKYHEMPFMRTKRSKYSVTSEMKNDFVEKKRRAFDPNNLSVARRAIVKATSVAEEAALNDEADEIRNAQFKARPLPNGAFVKNDPYALTKAAKGKVSIPFSPAKVRPSSSYRSSSNIYKRKDVSELLNRSLVSTSNNNTQVDSLRTIQLNNNEKTSTAMIKKSQYIDISERIKNDYGKDFEQVELEVSSEEEQDLSTLHQHISKLQAELSLKRLECIKAIEKIDDETLETIVLDQKTTSSDINSHDARLDRQPQNKNTSPRNENHTGPELHYEIKKNLISPKKSVPLYKRHNLWLQRKESKRREAKEREDRELTKVVTGRPNLHGAQESWTKAKEQHDGLLHDIESKESLRLKLREEKERVFREKQVVEIERLKAQSKQKDKTRKRDIDKKGQDLHMQKISRPSSKFKLESDAKVKQSLNVSANESKDNQDQARRDIDCGCNDNDAARITFADMNDKQFAKMLRKLKAKASKCNRHMHDTDETSDSNMCNEKNEASSCNGITIIENNTSAGKKRYLSSEAQAKIFSQVNEAIDPKNDLNILDIKNDSNVEMFKSFQFPYEHYEGGGIPFFDRSSSDEIGRFRVRDARDFHPDSLKRVEMLLSDVIPKYEGVYYLIGKSIDLSKYDSKKDYVVTVLFNRSRFDEDSAKIWWKNHRSHIITTA
jgi:hypothetical protein